MSKPETLSPMDLATAITAGGRFFGGDVVEMKLTLASGAIHKLTLPVAKAIDDPTDMMSPMQKAIIQVIDEMEIGELATNDDLAEKAGYANTGPLRSFVKSLAIAGRLKKQQYGWERVK